MAYDDYTEEEPQYPATGIHPGANTGSGPWAPGYDPGPNWNNGVAPPPPSGRYDYNNGSPVNDPSEVLKAGNGWVWEGPQTPTWNMSSNQWDRGVWQQRAGTGLGYVTDAPPPPTSDGPAPAPTGGGTTSGDGSVAPMQPQPSGVSVPSSTLPPDIAALFGQTPTKTPIQSAYQDALLKYMGKAQETPSLTDSTLAPQVEVFRAQQQRNQERQRLVAAERAAATGQSESGYLDTMINKGIQEQGFNTAAFNANLLGGEMGKRREELQAGLQLAAATGDAEAARELQARLAQVSAAMQQQGLNLQGQLGQGDLALRWGLGMEGLNQRALEIVMGGL